MTRRLFTILGLLVSTAGSAAAQDDAIRILNSTPERVTVEAAAPLPRLHPAGPQGEVRLDVPGWRLAAEPGVPELPRTGFRLALPPGTEPVLRVQVLSEQLLWSGPPLPVPTPRIEIDRHGLPMQEDQRIRDEQAYASAYPTEWAALGPTGRLRHQRVVQVVVNPYRWDPQAGGIRVATRLEIEVRFVPVNEGSPTMGLGRDWDRNAPAARPGPEHDSWERIYRGAVLNHEQARGWSRSPRLWTGIAAKALPVEGEMRVDVERTDIHRVRYEDLTAAGWDVFQPAAAQLALVERWFDETDPEDPFQENPVPIRVDDAGGDGVFGPGDSFYFFGLTAWDRYKPGMERKRYGRGNSYFLSLRAEGGARMPVGSSDLDEPGAVEVQSFVWTDHLEGDGVYMKTTAVEDSSSSRFLPLGIRCIEVDHFCWFGTQAGQHTVSFDLPGVQELLGLTVSLQGMTIPPDNFPARVTLRVAPQGGAYTDLPSPFTVPLKRRVYYQPSPEALGALSVTPGGNSFQIEMPADGYGAAVDWIEWTYRRSFQALDRRLAWDTDRLGGRREYNLAGFDGGAPLLFDLTDSTKTGTGTGPVSLSYTPEQFQGGTLRVRFDLGGSGENRTYLAVDPGRAAQPVLIQPVSTVDLTVPEGEDEELLVVCAPEFMDPVEPLVQARRNQGFSVRKVSIRDLYDQFSGGRQWPDAIRNHLRFLFRARTSDPSFLLLVGDASSDFAGVLSESGPNLVPTQTVFSLASSDQGPELVASDEWFVDNLTGTGEILDFHPDMHVGRIPAGTVGELEILVDKILDYEEFRETDTWRSRGLFISDDEYSSTISFSGSYKWNGDRYGIPRRSGDSVFRWAARECRRLIQQTAGLSGMRADTFFTAAYMDTSACLGRCVQYDSLGSSDCHDWRCRFDDCPDPLDCWASQVVYGSNETDPDYDSFDYGYYNLPPLLREKMNLGHLFVSYQGHANRYLMSHEYIFQDNPSVRQDTRFLENAERPFFFMGYGCHLAEFSSHDERGQAGRDCISEKLLFLDRGRGAVGSYASTGYEWLNDNHEMNLALFQAWFVDPPQDEAGRSRWLLGELISGGKYKLTEGGASPSLWGPVATYTLLGDPTMTLEMAPPRIEVTVNGNPWIEGEPVEAAPGADTLHISARLWDEVAMEASLYQEGEPVPDSLYSLVPDPDFPGTDRRYRLDYGATVMPPLEDYEIEIRAVDRNGRVRSALLPVRLSAQFYVLRGGLRQQIRAQDILEPADTVITALSSPVDLEAGDLDFWMDGNPLAVLAKTPDGARDWEIEAVLPAQLTESEHRLVLRVKRADGEIALRDAAFQGQSGESAVRLLEVFNFPNPFTEETRIYYRLNRSAEWARVQIFTLSGKRIWSAEGPARVNDNFIVWDGRDHDGDPVSNGLYFYKLEVRTVEGKSLKKIERLARIR